MIGAIAQTIFIAYAAPNSKTQAFAQRLVQAGKSVITFNSPINPVLQEQGITGLDIDLVQSPRGIRAVLSAISEQHLLGELVKMDNDDGLAVRS